MVGFSGEMTGMPRCIDVMGRTVPLDFEKVENGLRLHIKNSPDGLYFISLTTRESTWTGRFIVLNQKN
jgi:hypothetical protein